MKQSPVTPSYLKQKAKQIKKERSIPQHEALDEASKLFGFTNYKNYLNSLKANSRPQIGSVLSNLVAEKDSKKRLAVAMEFVSGNKVATCDLMEILKIFKSEKSVTAICEKSLLPKAIHKFMVEDLGRDESGEIEDYAPYFKIEEVSVKDLVYRIEGDEIAVDGNYDIKLVVDGEVDEEDKDHPSFTPRYMDGDFELLIDRDQNITVKESSIGHEW